MSSFKRKNPTKSKSVAYPGTRVSAASSSTINVSTGISSLDDLLGGGLPLSCSLVVAAPDFHSSYGQLVQKYFIAEGLASGHRVYIIDNDPEDFAKDSMWFPKSMPQKQEEKEEVMDQGSDEDEAVPADRKVKIAWRYEQMKQFQTTVSNQTSENYCHVFDLTNRLPEAMIAESHRSGTLRCLEQSPSEGVSPISVAYKDIESCLKEDSSLPVRICIPSLGSPLYWGDLTTQDVLYFLNKLRALLRKYPHACASITLSPQLSADQWGGPGWLQRIGWVTDASLSMAAFSADPALSTMFPAHHGIVRMLSLPSPSMLVAPSDRFSTLRGLSSSSSVFGGSGENNLAFKCTRKRLIFETLHLDLEGGVSERRTSAPSSSTAAEVSSTTNIRHHAANGTGAKIDIELERPQEVKVATAEQEYDSPRIPAAESKLKPKKPKKKVAFFSDRPEVYDF